MIQKGLKKETIKQKLRLLKVCRYCKRPPPPLYLFYILLGTGYFSVGIVGASAFLPTKDMEDPPPTPPYGGRGEASGGGSLSPVCAPNVA